MLDKKRTAILSIRVPKKLKEHYATLAHRESKTLSDKVNEILTEGME